MQDKISTGSCGERVVCRFLYSKGFEVCSRNVTYRVGELDIVARRKGILHFVEVKTALVGRTGRGASEQFDPAWNLHSRKVQKVVRAALKHVAVIGWTGPWQVDAALVWLAPDGSATIRYYEQILE